MSKLNRLEPLVDMPTMQNVIYIQDEGMSSGETSSDAKATKKKKKSKKKAKKRNWGGY